MSLKHWRAEIVSPKERCHSLPPSGATATETHSASYNSSVISTNPSDPNDAVPLHARHKILMEGREHRGSTKHQEATNRRLRNTGDYRLQPNGVKYHPLAASQL